MMKATGTRAEVMHGNAKHTTGGLKKPDLKMVRGRIVSKKASKQAKLRLKTSPFKQFVTMAKKSKGKKMKLSPKMNSREYNKIMK